MTSLKKFTASMLAFVLATAAITPAATTPATVCAASKIKLNKKSATIKVGKTVQLKVKGTKKKVKWSSSNTYVAKVTKKGKVIGKHAGSAKITAKVSNKKLTCKIKVKRKGKTVVTTIPKKTSIPIITRIPIVPTKTPVNTEIPSVPTKTPVNTEIPSIPTKTPVKTAPPVLPTKTPVVTKIPSVPTKAPVKTAPPVLPTKTPVKTAVPILPTKKPIATEVPGKQVELALNFYLEEYNPEAPSEQFINVHLVNHLTEDVYLETEAYLTTKGKDYPAMIYGSKEGDLKKISPTYEEDTYGEVVMYDSKEYVMGNYTDETFWLTSDENSKLTFYFRIGEKRYKAVINYNETGAVFREAADNEILLPIVTETPIISEQPVVTNTPEPTLEPVEMPFKFYIQEPTGMIQNGTETSTDYFPIAFESEELVTVKVEKGAMVTINGKTYPLYAWSEESLTLSGGDMELYVVPLYTRSMEDEIESGKLYVPYDCDNTVLSFYFEMNGNRYKAEAMADKNACKYYKVS